MIIISSWQTVGFHKGEYVKGIQVKTNVQDLLLKGKFCKNIQVNTIVKTDYDRIIN